MIYANPGDGPLLDSRARQSMRPAFAHPHPAELPRLGVFRMMRPRSTTPGICRCVSLRGGGRLAKIVASVGWVVMIGSFASLLLGRLPLAMFDHSIGTVPDVRSRARWLQVASRDL